MAEPPTTDPLLWIAKRDKRGRRAEKAVIDAAHRIWARVLYYVRRTHGDVSEAAEILEETVYSVSKAIREGREREPVRNMDSYLFYSLRGRDSLLM